MGRVCLEKRERLAGEVCEGGDGSVGEVVGDVSVGVLPVLLAALLLSAALLAVFVAVADATPAP